MKTNNGDLPAMPQCDRNIQVFSVSRGFSAKQCSGLTKREQFAMAAMQGILSCDNSEFTNVAAVSAVAHADALLAKLEK